jgi:hypothetical protein
MQREQLEMGNRNLQMNAKKSFPPLRKCRMRVNALMKVYMLMSVRMARVRCNNKEK